MLRWVLPVRFAAQYHASNAGVEAAYGESLSKARFATRDELSARGEPSTCIRMLCVLRSPVWARAQEY